MAASKPKKSVADEIREKVGMSAAKLRRMWREDGRKFKSKAAEDAAIRKHLKSVDDFIKVLAGGEVFRDSNGRITGGKL